MIIPTTQQKLAGLRALLRSADLDGLLVGSADEHLNEYLPEARKRREWLTGFTGSVGEALVSHEQAWLWVDSRYYEQADQQINPKDITVIKLGLPQQPTLYEHLETLGQGFRLGVDPNTVSVEAYQSFIKHGKVGGICLVPTPQNWVDQLKQQLDPRIQVTFADQPVIGVPSEVAGASVVEKLIQVRQLLTQKHVGVLPITKLDQIAWLFNLRGSDIPYNPVFISYALVTQDQAALFTNLARLSDSVRDQLDQAHIQFHPYDHYTQYLKDWVLQYGPLGVDPRHTTQGTVTAVADTAILEIEHPVEKLKARKNQVEIDHMRQANRQASRAKIRTLAWIDHQLRQGQPLNELDVATRIERYYQEEPGWQGLSFNTIAATGANSSIVHYGTPRSDQWLKSGHLLLLDSGSQFWGGTTDDTRTLAIGTPSDLQKHRYTEVLKAHIHCATQQFPVNTTGPQLDGIARWSMWQSGLDYGHGTGHGVGAFLNVHEGPNGINKRAHAVLEPGMINSVEPGFYEPGWGGIRLENLCVVAELPEREGWLHFQPLTWIPFELSLIDWDRISPFHQSWLDTYHQHVFELFVDTLNAQEQAWLQQACASTSAVMV